MNLLDIFIFSVNSIFPIILIICAGYFLKTKGIIDSSFVKAGNKVVFKLCLPILLFCNVAEIESLDGINVTSLIYVISVILLLVLIGYLFSFTTNVPKEKGVILQCVFRSNFALIGVPLAELLGGSSGVQSAALISVVSIPIYNIIAVIVLTAFVGDKKEGFLKSQLIAITKNPLIIGVVLGLIVMLIKLYLPAGVKSFYNDNFQFLNTTMKYLSRAATPLALLVLGGQFEFSRIAGYKKQIINGTLARTVIAPLIGVGLAIILQKLEVIYFEPGIYAAFIALFGTPVAVSSAIMAEAMNNDGQLASQLVVWTSLISMFTLFVIIFLCKLAGVI